MGVCMFNYPTISVFLKVFIFFCTLYIYLYTCTLCKVIIPHMFLIYLYLFKVYLKTLNKGTDAD